MTEPDQDLTLAALYNNVHLHRISVQDFTIFALTAARKSASIAAQELKISQPSVSYTLDKLRYAFHDELLVRTGNQMQLTDRGRELQKLIQSFQAEIAQIADASDFDPSSSTRNFQVGGVSASYVALSRRVVERVGRLAPDVQITFNPAPLDDPAKALAGPLDLAIGLSSLKHDDLELRHLMECKSVVYYDPHMRRPPETAEEYAKGPHCVVGSPGSFTKDIDQNLQALGLSARKIRCFSHSLGELETLIRGTDMLAAFWEEAHEQYFSRLARAPLPFENSIVSNVIMWHKSKSEDPGLRWLIEQFMA